MKVIADIEHVTATFENFERYLRSTVQSMQKEGLSVEIDHCFDGEYYSAVVVGYHEEDE